MTKDELVEKNASLEAQVRALQEELRGLRSQMTFMNQRHEVAAFMLGDAVINNRFLAESRVAEQPRPHDHEPGVLSAVEAQELGMA